ncbi:MAG: threonine/serine exporter family protein [Clostridia bacterium]|nr:threonine/serine exporter family protein [Clostridia bacterium]
MENNKNNIKDSYAAKVMKVAGNAAKMTLQYGGGSNRAEEVFLRMCESCQVSDPQISAVSTSISVSVIYDGEIYSSLFRVTRRGINLTKLNMINDLSRNFAAGSISLAEAQEELCRIDAAVSKFDNYGILAAGFSSAFFALLFNGGIIEFILTFFIGGFINYILSFFERANSYSFVNNLLGGIIDGALAIIMVVLFSQFNITVSAEPIIVGAMMPLLPGLAMTNAIKDTISGDYVSGVAGTMEAMSMAIALAAGVAAVIGVSLHLGVML